MVYLRIFFFLGVILSLNPIFAGDLEWSGLYRFEGYYIGKSELSDKGHEKSYGHHHLVLKPKITAADNLTIHSRFDIFNGVPNKPALHSSNNQFGAIWGNGVSGEDGGGLRASSENQQADNIEVSHLYLTLTQEFGSLIVGRAPLHFGLGMTHNAGEGIFDHWYDTRDLVGYKIVLWGNIYFFPMLAKVSEGPFHQSGEASDLLGHLQYKNPDTGLDMGLLYWSRQVDKEVNDANGIQNTDGTDGTEEVPGYGQGDITGAYDVKTTSLYLIQKRKGFRIGIEVAMQKGSTGITNRAGEGVSLSGQGAVAEFDWTGHPKWSGGVKLGYASGDDPTTTNQYEGFIFDRNYDVAFLMFNHPLGTADYFRTAVVTGRTNFESIDTPDVEAISNVTYISPYVTYRLSDSWLIDTRLTMGWLNVDPLDTGVKKGLGSELDFNFRFAPNNRMTWITGAGVLFPGEAFKGGSHNFDTEASFCLLTRAAIRF